MAKNSGFARVRVGGCSPPVPPGSYAYGSISWCKSVAVVCKWFHSIVVIDSKWRRDRTRSTTRTCFFTTRVKQRITGLHSTSILSPPTSTKYFLTSTGLFHPCWSAPTALAVPLPLPDNLYFPESHPSRKVYFSMFIRLVLYVWSALTMHSFCSMGFFKSLLTAWMNERMNEWMNEWIITYSLQ